MNCISRQELEQFLQGNIEPQRLLAVDEHVSACPDCKATLQNMPAGRIAGTGLGIALLGVQECPPYEKTFRIC